ncbi:MAG: Peptidyl-prolyl cis-trans isomerase PpiC [Acidimicrobiales bacterium]|nr:Peptidyl-prolyl cis-trans isomerase PpiC [Acidimicrobiales bacterium]
MNPSATHRRRAAVPAVLALVALVAASCSAIGPVGRAPAASVNGKDISAQKVFDLLEAQQRNLDVEKAEAKKAKQPTPSAPSFRGDSTSSWNMTLFANSLQPLIELEVLKAALAKRGATITSENRKEAHDTLAAQLGGEAALKKRDKVLVSFFEGLTSAQYALRDTLAKGDTGVAARQRQLRAAYEQQKQARSTVCVAVIVVPTDAEARAAKARIDKGESFAAVAKAVSKDQTAPTGGDAGCGPLSQIAQQVGLDVTKAKTGGVYGPIKNQGVVILLAIKSLTTPTFAELMPTLAKEIAPVGTKETSAEITKLLGAADVQVDPRYGSWDRAGRRVKPPAGATTSTSAPTTAAPVPGA